MPIHRKDPDIAYWLTLTPRYRPPLRQDNALYWLTLQT